ncbi:MAG: AAA family ATPase [Planctomycetes bacterium]|nr:AAA family ATPase [Planctomycetota bacterium]
MLWIVSREEVRVERALIEAAAAARYPVKCWDCAAGITSSSGTTLDANMRDPSQVLAAIQASDERTVWLLRDLHKWLDPVVLRSMRNAARSLQVRPNDKAAAIVVLSPSGEVPPELSGHATVVEWPLPDRAEVATLLDDVLRALPENVRADAAPNGTRDAAIDAAVGLTAEEAANCYARSLVTSRKIDPVLVAQEKRRVIARERVLTWTDPDPRGLDAVGGLDVLKDWLRARRAGFTAKAREYGLPAPKGMLLVGVPGCGKSLTAKAVAAAWQMPLLRLDMGALRSKYVGDSEANIRKALAVAEAVSPCVLWLDEIEKALAGSTGQQGDGGVSADALGAVLSWMQERAGSVFVVATANDVRALPPELLRKGRFDEVFWVDLPTQLERAAIARAAVKERGRTISDADAARIAEATRAFTGSEIAAVVPDAMFAAFAEGREVTADDIVAACATVVPLSKTAADKIQDLRQWAKGRARPASVQAASESTARQLDIG